MRRNRTREHLKRSIALYNIDVRLFDEERMDDVMNDLQYRRQQFGMHGE